MSDQTGANTDLLAVSRCLEELTELLDDEFKLLQSSPAEPLTELIHKKDLLIQSISQREPALQKVLEAASDDPEITAFKGRLTQCFELNQRNKEVANVHLSHTRKSLELLRSMLKLNDVPVYGATGKVSVSREKRHFGSA